MRKIWLCALAALAVGLAGCGKEEKKQKPAFKLPIEIKDEGVDATLGGGKMPKDAPAYAKLYPGADVMSVIKNIGGPGTATMVMYTVPGKPEPVIAFYRKLAEEHGLEQVSDKEAFGSRFLRFKTDKKVLSLSFAERTAGETMVELTYR